MFHVIIVKNVAALAEATAAITSVPPLASTADRAGKRLDAVLRQLLDVVERYAKSLDLILNEVDSLTAWQMCDALVKSISEHEERLRTPEFEKQIEDVMRRNVKLGTRARRLRDQLLPMLEAWRIGLMDRLARVTFQFRSRGLRLMLESIDCELAVGADDKQALEKLRARFAFAKPGDHILLGDVSESSKRVLRRAIRLVEDRKKAAQEAMEAIRPLSTELLDEAEARARRPDGSIDALALGLAIAADFGPGVSSQDPFARFGHKDDRRHHLMDDDE